jgi:hypothetical protein
MRAGADDPPSISAKRRLPLAGQWRWGLATIDPRVGGFERRGVDEALGSRSSLPHNLDPRVSRLVPCAPQHTLQSLDRTQRDRRLFLGHRQRPDPVDDDAGGWRRKHGAEIVAGIHVVSVDLPDLTSCFGQLPRPASGLRETRNRCSSDSPPPGGVYPPDISFLISQSSSFQGCSTPSAPSVRAAAVIPFSPAGDS